MSLISQILKKIDNSLTEVGVACPLVVDLLPDDGEGDRLAAFGRVEDLVTTRRHRHVHRREHGRQHTVGN